MVRADIVEGALEKRCQELFPNINKPFGGLYVYLFGDFRQLPPVRDLPLYSDTFTDELSTHGNLIFNTFQFFKELTQSFRQFNDSPDFINLLDR